MTEIRQIWIGVSQFAKCVLKPHQRENSFPLCGDIFPIYYKPLFAMWIYTEMIFQVRHPNSIADRAHDASIALWMTCKPWAPTITPPGLAIE